MFSERFVYVSMTSNNWNTPITNPCLEWWGEGRWQSSGGRASSIRLHGRRGRRRRRRRPGHGRRRGRWGRSFEVGCVWHNIVFFIVNSYVCCFSLTDDSHALKLLCNAMSLLSLTADQMLRHGSRNYSVSAFLDSFAGSLFFSQAWLLPERQFTFLPHNTSFSNDHVTWFISVKPFSWSTLLHFTTESLICCFLFFSFRNQMLKMLNFSFSNQMLNHKDQSIPRGMKGLSYWNNYDSLDMYSRNGKRFNRSKSGQQRLLFSSYEDLW